MLFSWKISKTCLDQLENKTAILDFGTLQKVTTLLQKLFRTLRRTHLPYLWRPCFFSESRQNEPSIDASYQVSVHLAKRFQRRKFLDIDQSEARIAYGGHVCYWIEIINLYRRLSIDASYQVSINFAERFQRRSFLKIDQSETRIACGGHVC
jgi:hypothetical protein